MILLKKTGFDALKTVIKKVSHKAAKTIGEFIGNKIADALAKLYENEIVKPKAMPEGNSKVVEEIIIPPRKREELLTIQIFWQKNRLK